MDDAAWRDASELGRRQHKAALEAVRERAAKRGKTLSHRDAMRQATLLYRRGKTKPEEASPQDPPNDPLVRLVAALAEVIERSKAERIAAAISDMIEAHGARKVEHPRTFKTEADLPPLIDVKRVSKMLAISERTVWRKSREDLSFPAVVHIGTRRRFRSREVLAWIEQQSREAA